MPITGFMDLQGNTWPRARSGAEAILPRTTDRNSLIERIEQHARPGSNLAERFAALVLLVLSAPLLVVLAIGVLLVDGWPVFYGGERLGLRKRRFTLYKIRTLKRDAERKAADRSIERRDGLEIPGGRWLRDSRLDELPQLWNIVRGEMSFIGPRPERLQVYLSQCRSIGSYDYRFGVRPGLIGPSQLFTPHGTPKRIRAWIDNAWIRRGSRWWQDVGMTLYAPLVMCRKLATLVVESLCDDTLRARLLSRPAHERSLRRARPASAFVVFPPSKGLPGGALARLVDMNDEAIRIHSHQLVNPMSEGSAFHIRLEIDLAGGNGARRIRSARCLAVVAQRRRRLEGYTFVLRYWPLTARSQYAIHQYFLGDSLAPSRAPAPRASFPRTVESPRARKLVPSTATPVITT